MKVIKLEILVEAPDDFPGSEVARLINRVLDTGWGAAMDTEDDDDVGLLEKLSVHEPEVVN